MTSECGAEYSRLFHGWTNDIIYDISVEQNFPELSLEHSRTDDIIPCRYNFVKYLVGQSILIEKK
jgi:hypothetical protein